MTILVQSQKKLKPILNFQVNNFKMFFIILWKIVIYNTCRCIQSKLNNIFSKWQQIHWSKHEISTHLADIFNLSFSLGVFQSLLKIGKVIPVHKKDSKLFCSNNRSISLLSNTDKIIEKLMYNRSYKFLDKSNITYSLQFGFQQHYSTLHALLNVAEVIVKALDNGNFACGILLAFRRLLILGIIAFCWANCELWNMWIDKQMVWIIFSKP